MRAAARGEAAGFVPGQLVVKLSPRAGARAREGMQRGFGATLGDADAAALDALPENYRTIIEMRHFEGLGYDEIGKRLGLGRNGVNARLTRARAMLRERMQK